MSEILNTHTLWMGITEKLAVSEEKKISKLGNTAIETVYSEIQKKRDTENNIKYQCCEMVSSGLIYV